MNLVTLSKLASIWFLTALAVHVEGHSGASLDAERQPYSCASSSKAAGSSRVRRISSITKELASDPKYAAKGMEFQCDAYCSDVIRALTGDVPDELNGGSRSAYTALEQAASWQLFEVGEDPEKAFEEAQLAANVGLLVLAIHPGEGDEQPAHAAIVVPSALKGGALAPSGKWGMNVPLVANAGSKVFAHKGLSFAFTKDKRSRLRIFVHQPALTFSIVDYLDARMVPSTFDARSKLFASHCSSDEYQGSAEQNLSLLTTLLEDSKTFRVPFPSNNAASCQAFYEDEEVARYLTNAFKGNAIDACMVTGTSTPMKKIRVSLQELYAKAEPQNGEYFTAKEHKALHDAAYTAAGCKEDSAGMVGWYWMQIVPTHRAIVKESIERFGKCTVDPE